MPLLPLYDRLFQNFLVILHSWSVKIRWECGHTDRQAGQIQNVVQSQQNLKLIVLVKSLEVKNKFVCQPETRWSGTAGQISATPTPIIRRQTHGEYINIDLYSFVLIFFSKHSIKTESSRQFCFVCFFLLASRTNNTAARVGLSFSKIVK